MKQTDLASLESALYGVVRLVAGHREWKEVADIPDKRKWLPTLIAKTTQDLIDANADISQGDPRLPGQLMRKLQGYQQLALLERFCMDEVEW